MVFAGNSQARTAMALAMAPLLALALYGHAGPARANAAGDAAGPQAQSKAPAFGWSSAERLRFKRNWGVDIEGVKVVSSGYMLAFRYRVLDAAKAKPLSDKRSRPFLVDEATGVTLSVPVMDKVGELRQSSEPEEGRSYFIIFGNPGKLVKPGGRVSVAIGNFHVEDIAVQ